MPKFVCDVCREEFNQAWSEAEAEAELEREFPGAKKEECLVVCDECKRELSRWLNVS